MYGLNPGTKIAQYSLEAPLGQGGQGSVWRARASDPSGQPTGEPVALKVIPVRGTPVTMVERVRREAEALMALSQGNPSIVTCLGIHEDTALGVLAVAMEMVDGTELQVALQDRRCDGPAREQLLMHVARALGYLHAAGVIHRDIKPANILVKHRFFENPKDPSTVKLVDFGIATPKGNPKPLTEVGTVIGTPAYMPPERIDPLFWKPARGLPAEDVFAFGVIAYEALFGQHPAHVEDDGTLSVYAERYRAISRTHEVWPALPPHHLAPALSGALALDVDRRLPDGNAVVQAMSNGARTVDDPSLRPSNPPRTELGIPVMAMPDNGGFAPPGQTQVAMLAQNPSAPSISGSWTPAPPPQASWPAIQPSVQPIAPGVPERRPSKGGLSPALAVLGVFGLLAIGVPSVVLASRYVGKGSDDGPPIAAPIETVSAPVAATTGAAPTDTVPTAIPTPTFTATPPVTTTHPTTHPTATTTHPTPTATTPTATTTATQPTGFPNWGYPPPTATTTTAPTAQPTTQPTAQPTTQPTTTSTGNGRPPIIGQPVGTATTQPTATSTTPPPHTGGIFGRFPPIFTGRPNPNGNGNGRPAGTSTGNTNGRPPPIIHR